MNNISEELAQEKFKITQQENHYILMKKKRYGNYAAHMFFYSLIIPVYAYAYS